MCIRDRIYDVYNALIANSVIDINKFRDANASDTEKKLYAKFQQKQQQVFDTITNRLTAENPPAVKDEDDQIQEYLTYICDDLLRDTPVSYTHLMYRIRQQQRGRICYLRKHME